MGCDQSFAGKVDSKLLKEFIDVKKCRKFEIIHINMVSDPLDVPNI